MTSRIFAKVALTALVVMATSPASAQMAAPAPTPTGPLTAPAERTHCLAVGRAMAGIQAKSAENAAMFAKVYPNPDESQKAINAQVTKIGSTAGTLADALTKVYGDAPAPTAAEQASTSARGLRELIPDVKHCLS